MHIYHIVPRDLVGSHLIPLNQMKKIHPLLYSKEVSKYSGREGLLERYIPKVDCLWNDVLHFSSISPRIIFGRLQELGFGSYQGLRWFEVPLSLIEEFKPVIYRAPDNPRSNFKLEEQDIEFLNVELYDEPKVLPPQTKTYFMECQKQDRTPLPFQFIPHVLVRGAIDISGMKIFSQ